jgi:Na+/proline symporter
MAGMVIAAIYIINLPEIGGLDQLVNHPEVATKKKFLPDFTDPNVAVPIFFIPLAVQWWSSWYPGAEPGGGGYVAQRMLAAKNEKEATKATLLFNVAHYALRPWPWILIALASLIIFPDLESVKRAFPSISDDILAHDLAFPAMLTLLPKGLLGIVIASLIAALMSTISTHLNWGASYLVNDFFVRFINPHATEKEKVLIGRIGTVGLMLLSALFALYLTNAFQAFNILLQIGAGTGLLFLMRWFWWRINAYSEIVAMLISLLIAIYFEIFYSGDLEAYQRLSIGVIITTIIWITVTWITRPTDMNVLKSFYIKIQPHDSGWRTVSKSLDNISFQKNDTSFTNELLMVFVSCSLVYSALFGIGFWMYGKILFALLCLAIVIFSILALFKLWKL